MTYSSSTPHQKQLMEWWRAHTVNKPLTFHPNECGTVGTSECIRAVLERHPEALRLSLRIQGTEIWIKLFPSKGKGQCTQKHKGSQHMRLCHKSVPVNITGPCVAWSEGDRARWACLKNKPHGSTKTSRWGSCPKESKMVNNSTTTHLFKRNGNMHIGLPPGVHSSHKVETTQCPSADDYTKCGIFTQ